MPSTRAWHRSCVQEAQTQLQKMVRAGKQPEAHKAVAATVGKLLAWMGQAIHHLQPEDYEREHNIWSGEEARAREQSGVLRGSSSHESHDIESIARHPGKLPVRRASSGMDGPAASGLLRSAWARLTLAWWPDPWAGLGDFEQLRSGGRVL